MPLRLDTRDTEQNKAARLKASEGFELLPRGFTTQKYFMFRVYKIFSLLEIFLIFGFDISSILKYFYVSDNVYTTEIF